MALFISLRYSALDSALAAIVVSRQGYLSCRALTAVSGWRHIAAWFGNDRISRFARPLTVPQNRLEDKTGAQPDEGGLLLHDLEKLIHADISVTALSVAGVIVCAANLAFYRRQARLRIRRSPDRTLTVSLFLFAK